MDNKEEGDGSKDPSHKAAFVKRIKDRRIIIISKCHERSEFSRLQNKKEIESGISFWTPLIIPLMGHIIISRVFVTHHETGSFFPSGVNILFHQNSKSHCYSCLFTLSPHVSTATRDDRLSHCLIRVLMSVTEYLSYVNTRSFLDFQRKQE